MLSNLLSLFAVLQLALAAPTPISDEASSTLERRFSESTPWHLSNIAYFAPKAHSTKGQSFSFHFCDENAGIKLETSCSRTLPKGSNLSIIDTDNYYPCNNNTVAFKFNGNSINITRNYIDPSVGPCPLYCDVEAFGGADLTFKATKGPQGTTNREANLDVVISALAA